jgi:hypothetical protein
MKNLNLFKESFLNNLGKQHQKINILVYLICFTYTVSHAQEPLKGKELFQYDLDQRQMEYKCPKGWSEDFEYERFDPAYHSLTGTYYRIESPRKDVVIVFNLQNFQTIEDSIRLIPLVKISNKLYPNVKNHARNEQYILHAAIQADTLSGRGITYYPEKYARKTFGADHAGRYLLLQKQMFHERFDRCEVVYLFKNEVGLVELFYYHNAKTRDIEKYIKTTAGMIRFKKIKN